MSHELEGEIIPPESRSHEEGVMRPKLIFTQEQLKRLSILQTRTIYYQDWYDQFAESASFTDFIVENYGSRFLSDDEDDRPRHHPVYFIDTDSRDSGFDPDFNVF